MRREHVFEDSFYQLRMRSPEEMRAKLKWVPHRQASGRRWTGGRRCRLLAACGMSPGPLPASLRLAGSPPATPARSVVFTGEEGVDAGGVTREWYQARCSRSVCSPGSVQDTLMV